MTKWLFDDHPPPLLIFLKEQTGRSQSFNRDFEKAVRDRQVEEAITRRARSLVQFAQMIIKSLIGLSVVQISLDIAHAIGQPLPCFGIQLIESGFPIGTHKALYGVGKSLAPFLSCLRGEVHADDPEFVR